MNPMLEIRNLHVSVDGKPILKGIDLSLDAGEVHAIMGPNGSGKSTLSHVIAGHEDYEITDGEILYRGRDLRDVPVEERAREGIFLALQYPVTIPGVSNAEFLRTAVNAVREHRGESRLDAIDFLGLVREKLAVVRMDQAFLKRSVNDGFSGGERKRNEILQMSMLEPALCVLDETDSGLDIDALRIVAEGVNALRGPERSMLVITHYQRLLDHLVPDVTHVLMDGRIVKTAGPELAKELEARGYDWIEEELVAEASRG